MQQDVSSLRAQFSLLLVVYLTVKILQCIIWQCSLPGPRRALKAILGRGVPKAFKPRPCLREICSFGYPVYYKET